MRRRGKPKCVRWVEERWPAMSRLQRDGSRHVFILGVRFGRADFWVMDLTAATKGTVHALELAKNYQLEEAHEQQQPGARAIA